MIPDRFPVDVEGIGEFTFRRRSMRDQVWIESETLRMTGGDTADPTLRAMAMDMASVARLTVEHPKGWDIDAMDPFDPAHVTKIWTVGGALRKEEERFRSGPAAERPPVGPDA